LAADVPGMTVSAFHDASAGALVVVGVKEGGPKTVNVVTPRTAGVVDSWDFYMTTRSVDCLKVATVMTADGTIELELPDEAVFTLVGKLKK